MSKNYTKSFFHHFIRNLTLGILILSLIIFMGMLGYHFVENFGWIDSYANAAMVVSGVGTLNSPITDEGKIFVATYSVIGGACYLLVIAVVFAPIFHWLFRRVKVEDREHFKD